MSELSCRDVSGKLSDLLSGDLTPDLAADLESHLARCKACRAMATDLVWQDLALAARAGRESLPEIQGRIHQALAPRRRLWSRPWSLAAASILLAAAGVSAFVAFRADPSSMKDQEAAVSQPEGIERPERSDSQRVLLRPDAPTTPDGNSPPKLELAPEKPRSATEPAPQAPRSPDVKPKEAVPQPESPKDPGERIPPAPPAPPPSAAPRTVAAAAEIKEVHGEVYVVSPPQRARVTGPHVVLAGQGIETVGEKSHAALSFPDGTRLDVMAETTIQGLFDRGVPPGGKAKAGKRVFLARGRMKADVAKQPQGEAMVLTTSSGEIKVMGTRFEVTSGADDSTRVEVEEGWVGMTRLRDGAWVEVAAGNYAVAAQGVELVARPRAQANPRDPLQRKVDAAIQKGISYLASQADAKGLEGAGNIMTRYKMNFDELVLFTFIHAGVSEQDPRYQGLFKSVMEKKLERTYAVALRAMILEEIDRVRYQGAIAQCAQYLLDNQCANGQWGYGEPTPFAAEVDGRDVATPGGSRPRSSSNPREKPKVVKHIPVTRRRDGAAASGDNSNSQYAALGLRACHDAGILLPEDVVALALKAWRQSQKSDGGWCYDTSDGHKAYGSMTAGGVGSLVIYDYIRGGPGSWAKDKDVHAGMAWMGRNFTVSFDPGTKPCRDPERENSEFGLHYFLYAMERAGILYGTNTIGGHSWYIEGAKSLIESQGNNGSWAPRGEIKEGGSYGTIGPTCFAILFLKRATLPLVDVPSVDRGQRK